MKKLKSKLFRKFELNQSEMSSLVGGFYTDMTSDTNVEGGTFDISYNTMDSSGGSIGTDTTNTGTASRDQPGECLTHA